MRAVSFVTGNRSRREHDDDAYLVPSDWEDDDMNDDDWGSGTGAAGKRARDRERALIQVNGAIQYTSSRVRVRVRVSY